MIQLYLAENFHRLEKLLMDYSNITKFNHKQQTSLFGLNVWIIHIVGESKRKELQRILKKSPVGFNLQVFEFFEQDEGMFHAKFPKLINRNSIKCSITCD